MISQAIIFNEFEELLMVQQMTQRGKIIWNFPGGNVEEGETFEEAVIREVMEETGFRVEIANKLFESERKATFICKIVGGEIKTEDDPDIFDVQWVSLQDTAKFDEIVSDILFLYFQQL